MTSPCEELSADLCLMDNERKKSLGTRCSSTKLHSIERITPSYDQRISLLLVYFECNTSVEIDKKNDLARFEIDMPENKLIFFDEIAIK